MYKILSRISLVFAIMLPIGGCGRSSSLAAAATPSIMPTIAATPTLTGASSVAAGGLPPLNKPVHAQVGPMYLDSPGGFVCTNSPGLSGRVVLADPSRTSYSQGDLDQMASALNAYTDAATVASDLGVGQVGDDPDAAPSLPPTLSLVPGGRTCDLILTVTNTSETQLTITALNLRLIADVHLDGYHYNLIDICAILKEPGCFGAGGQGGAACTSYVGLFSLPATAHKAGQVMTLSLANPPSDAQVFCGGVQIASHAVARFILILKASSASIYSIQPSFTLQGASGGTETLDIPPLAGYLVFSDPKQVTCYYPNGTTLVAYPPDDTGSYDGFNPNGTAYCI